MGSSIDAPDEGTGGAVGEDTGVNVGVCPASDWGVGASDEKLGVVGVDDVDGVTGVDTWREDWLAAIVVGEDASEGSSPHAPSAKANKAPPKATVRNFNRMGLF